jgi:hypothetical protein
MAVGTDFNVQRLVDRRSGLESIAATAIDLDFEVIGVYAGFHQISHVNFAGLCGATKKYTRICPCAQRARMHCCGNAVMSGLSKVEMSGTVVPPNAGAYRFRKRTAPEFRRRPLRQVPIPSGV